MPGGEMFGDSAGWRASGGVGLENHFGVPWSVGLWYGYASVMLDGFSSQSQQGGLWLGLPISADGIPVSLVPEVFGGVEYNQLQSGSASKYPVMGGMVEPGIELRLGFFKPLEIGLYGGYAFAYYPEFIARNFSAGVTIAYVIPAFENDNSNTFLVKDDLQSYPGSFVKTNVVVITVTNETNTIPNSAVQAEFAKEIQAVLTASETNVKPAAASNQAVSPVSNVAANPAAGVSNKVTNSSVAVTNAPVVAAAKVVTNENAPSLETEKDELVIRFSEVLFDKESAVLPSQSIDLVRKLGQTFKKYPKLTIMVEGYTDNKGDPKFNLDLSGKRAKAVADELFRSGVSQKQVHYEGFGDSNPVAPNDTEENRMKNRRVNIRLQFTNAQK